MLTGTPAASMTRRFVLAIRVSKKGSAMKLSRTLMSAGAALALGACVAGPEPDADQHGHSTAAAPLTISIISLVIAAWRTRFICSV